MIKGLGPAPFIGFGASDRCAQSITIGERTFSAARMEYAPSWILVGHEPSAPSGMLMNLRLLLSRSKRLSALALSFSIHLRCSSCWMLSKVWDCVPCQPAHHLGTVQAWSVYNLLTNLKARALKTCCCLWMYGLDFLLQLHAKKKIPALKSVRIAPWESWS